MAGAGGIEPPNVGTKNRCLTAWRRPNMAKKARQDAKTTEVFALMQGGFCGYFPPFLPTCGQIP